MYINNLKVAEVATLKKLLKKSTRYFNLVEIKKDSSFCEFDEDIEDYTSISNFSISKKDFKVLRNTLNCYVSRQTFETCRYTVQIMYLNPTLLNKVYFFSIDNTLYKEVDALLNDASYFDTDEYNNSILSDEISAIRWLGAYNTNCIENKQDFETCLNWEFQGKDREVAGEIYSNISIYDDSVTFFDNLHHKLTSEYSDNLYKRCKLGVLYSYIDIRKAYTCDVWSAQAGKCLVATDSHAKDYEMNYFSTNDKIWSDFNYIDCKSDDFNIYHTECFIKEQARPIGIIVRKPNTWNGYKLKLVKKYANKYNLHIYYINY